ncbi:Pep3/Vps18/deep orange family-domain-containing protein [Chytriomyces sp. MP71]|nr:Pep3/Vps18/deep orange family-domain-containing protein [Chytriomyces sp. MP71]
MDLFEEFEGRTHIGTAASSNHGGLSGGGNPRNGNAVLHALGPGFIHSQYTTSNSVFALDRVQFSFPGSLVAMAVADNMMAVALRTSSNASILFWIDLGQSQAIEEIDIAMRIKNDSVRKIFMDPYARHLIISTQLGDNYYLHKGWKKCKNLSKFKGVIIETIAWGSPPSNIAHSSQGQQLPSSALDPNSTGLMLIGSKQGHIFEAELVPTDDYFKKEERYFQQIFTMPDDLPVLGIRKVKFPNSANRFAIVLNTPNRLYQFIGTAFENAEAGGFGHLFGAADVGSNYQELPTIGEDALQVWSLPTENGGALVHKRFAWLTVPGIYAGEFNPTSIHSETIITNAELHPVSVSAADSTTETPLSVALTEFHYIVLYSDRVRAISCLTNELVFDERIVLDDREIVLGLVVDEGKETYWIYTNTSVHEIIVTDEDRDVWKIYLSRRNFDTALLFAKTDVQRDRVVTAQAEYYFSEKRYRLAATYFAQSTSASFEEIALRFIGLNEMSALKQFLGKRLEGIKSNEPTKMTILCMWLLELFVHELDTAESKLTARRASLYVPTASDESSGAKEIEQVREELHTFLNARKDVINKDVAFQLFSSHGRTREMLFFAEIIKDYERIINYWISEKEWMKALNILNRQNSNEYYYKFSTILIEQIPVDLVTSWIQHPGLDPKSLLPALLKYEALVSKRVNSSQNQAIRYLNHITQKMASADSSVHNYLLSLHVSHAKLDEERELMAFLSSQDDDPRYDVQYALRLCMKERLVQSSIFIYSKLGLYEQAVDLALKHHDIELAQINADKPVDDDILRKKLWLKIARFVVDDRKDIKQAIHFLKQCDLLRIEDILPFFPDFVLIDDFKADLCSALEEYNEHIELLKNEMDEATRSAENIRKDIHNLKNRSVLIHVTEQCSFCTLSLLTRQFLVFPCKHVFHADCLTSMELEKELSSECPLCNDVMIKSVNKPFDEDLSFLVV